MTAHAKLLRIGELAKRSGKTVRALHLYEELGLLRPAHRSQGGFRLYHPHSVARVEWIAKLQDAGFSLAALKDLLHDVEIERVAPEAMARVRAVFEEKLAETRAARARLEKLEADLRASLAYLDGCRTCETDHTPHECCACSINGHEGHAQPILVAGLHQAPRSTAR
ncbi:MAG TPA: MerR family transcriptional regulator [Polyangiaceae bacterium]|nr:MerR family transcriptional regulator [Polyangiaceae bacterium]